MESVIATNAPTPAVLKNRLRLPTPTPAVLKNRLRLPTPTPAVLKNRLRLQLKTCDSTDSRLRLHNPVFYVSVIPISVARKVAWSRAVQTLVGITLTRNTAPALLCSALLLFVWTWPNGFKVQQW